MSQSSAAQSGLITLDEGYVNTGSTTSSITYLDGEKGILRYRGYPIEVLAERCDFVEVSYLLIYGTLPTKKELASFSGSLAHHTMIHEEMRAFYNGFLETRTRWQFLEVSSALFQPSIKIRSTFEIPDKSK